jgi:DNA-binding transcriptional regulator YiaG
MEKSNAESHRVLINFLKDTQEHIKAANKNLYSPEYAHVLATLMALVVRQEGAEKKLNDQLLELLDILEAKGWRLAEVILILSELLVRLFKIYAEDTEKSTEVKLSVLTKAQEEGDNGISGHNNN